VSASNDMFTDDGAQSQHATKELTMISTNFENRQSLCRWR